jgi:small-conductance mechanosensitive channel
MSRALAMLRNQMASASRDSQLAAMAAQASALEAKASQAAAARASALARTRAEIKALPRRRRPTAAEQSQRAALQAQETVLAGQFAQAQALRTDASTTFRLIAEQRRKGFAGRVLQRTAGPLSPAFWRSLAGAGADLDRLAMVAGRISDAASRAAEPRGAAGLALGVLGALFIAWPARRRLHRLHLGPRLRAPARVSAAALLWTVAVDIGLAALAGQIVRLSAQWAGLSDPTADRLLGAAVGALVWAAAVLSLGRALAGAPDPNRRLLPVSDGQAARARAALWAIALVTAAGTLLQTLIYVAGASVAIGIAVNCLVSLAYAATAALILGAFAGPTDGEGAPAARPAWTLIAVALAAAILATVGAVLLGYTTLAALISGQVFWLSLLGAVTYLLLKVIDQLVGALFSARSRAAAEVSGVFGLKLSTVLQLGVLAGAALQLIVALAAVTLALTPFGEGGELLLAHLRDLSAPLHIGKVTISPLGVAAGLATFAVGVALAHAARAWLTRRYLPVTDWDAGLRNSVSTGVAYVGVAAALACGLVVTGVSLTQVALVTSALSVGIGFGLQQVVQNFVAGVILLVERPIKVGDWVSVGGVEGDVLDIRVRATEIRAFDCSTVIVPNSNLITLNVQNKTLGPAHSRVQLQVGVAKPADVARARDLILSLVGSHAEVLKAPAPTVRIDGLAAAGGANLSALFYVADPRQAPQVKSDLFFELLAQFQAQGVAFL